MSRLAIAYRASDEFGQVSGPGWVVLEDGKRVDWPLIAPARRPGRARGLPPLLRPAGLRRGQ